MLMDDSSLQTSADGGSTMGNLQYTSTSEYGIQFYIEFSAPWDGAGLLGYGMVLLVNVLHPPCRVAQATLVVC